MATMARLYNFITGQPANADAVDAEFDQIITKINTGLVHTDGTVAMTGGLTLPANPTAALHAATKQYVDAQVSAPAMPGVIAIYGGVAPPVGWLECAGAAVSRTTYATLFGVLGTAFGAGDGATTFNLPDMKGRVPVGLGIGGGLVGNWTRGLKYGSEEYQAHSHGLVDDAVQGFNFAKIPGDGVIGLPYGSTNRQTAVAGTGQGNNWQPSLGIMFIVKT